MLYTSKDVCRILGIKPDQLSYYVRTKKLIKPAVIGKGRGSAHKFSLENLYQIALIQRLLKYGIELNFTKNIMNKTKTALPSLTIFDIYKEKKYKEGGLLFEIYNVRKTFSIFIVTREELLRNIRVRFDPGNKEKNKDVLIIDIGNILSEIEEKTGERF